VSQGQLWAGSRELRYMIEALAQIPSTYQLPAGNPSRSKAQTTLTKWEQGVVDLVAEGLSNRDISRQLNLSEYTVRYYLFRIFNKVGASNRLELSLYVINRSSGDRSTD
jgi:DNA-binding NarL/FixJ family response regulator